MTDETASAGPDQQRPRAGRRGRPALSAWAKGVRADLLARNDFAAHEHLPLHYALIFFSVADGLVIEAEALTGRERAMRLKAAGDAATTALRFWRVLRFEDPARPTRRVGRPADDAWSQHRQAGAAAHLRAMGRDA